MRSGNKTRFAILGMLFDAPSSGYEIKSLMARSTVYFWRESDSTIYPMLKLLAREGKVVSEIVSVGKKQKEVFSITEAGRKEFLAWVKGPTGSEIRRSEFFLKLFFITEKEEMRRLYQEELEKAETTYQELKRIEERLDGLPDFSLKETRLGLLRQGMAHLELEIKWLKENVS